MNGPAVLVLTLTADELRSLVRSEVDAALAAHAPAPPATSALLDARALAEALKVSRVTVARLVHEGMPVALHVGASPRYSIDEVRVWLEARGRLGTKARQPKAPCETIAGVRLLSRGDRRTAQ